MSSSDSPVFMFDDRDPEMRGAYETARGTFGYFWRQVVNDRGRIVPALEMAMVKAPFTDGPARSKQAPEAEQMWISEIDFDGKLIHGVLINSPNWLRSVKEGDPVRMPISRITDWMFVIDNHAYGGFTVNLMRSRMDRNERRQHDSAWGLEFADPTELRLEPDGEGDYDRTITRSLREHLAKNPSAARQKGHNGWTLLHQQASAGRIGTVQLLVAAGADLNATTSTGLTPLQLADSLGWDDVAEYLRAKAR